MIILPIEDGHKKSHFKPFWDIILSFNGNVKGKHPLLNHDISHEQLLQHVGLCFHFQTHPYSWIIDLKWVVFSPSSITIHEVSWSPHVDWWIPMSRPHVDWWFPLNSYFWDGVSVQSARNEGASGTSCVEAGWDEICVRKGRVFFGTRTWNVGFVMVDRKKPRQTGWYRMVQANGSKLLDSQIWMA